MTTPRLALIHAVRVAIAPIEDAFARLWPEAGLMNLLDDSLSRDLKQDGRITAAMKQRFVDLARYAHGTGADGVLFTCSAFGPCIAAANRAVPVPVLKPNAAMFSEALSMDDRVGLLASFQPSLAPMVDEYSAMGGADLETACAPEAMRALDNADPATHDRLLVEAAGAMSCDVILLAQFSTARARAAVAEATGKPVLTSPDSAVMALRQALGG